MRNRFTFFAMLLFFVFPIIFLGCGKSIKNKVTATLQESIEFLRSQEGQEMLLRQISDYFTSMGVDPSNPDEVNAFLEKLKVEDSEVYSQLMSYLNKALSGMAPEEQPVDQTQVPDAEVSPESNVNINEPNETLPQNL
jgi:hypothetical protein